MIEDRDGILWIGTSDGLFRYNTAEQVSKIKQYRYFNEREARSYRFPQPVNEICEDKNGQLWMSCIDIGDGVNFGLRTFDKKTELLTYMMVDSTFRERGEEESVESYIGCIYSDRQGDLWFSSQNGLLKYDFEKKNFIRFLPDPDNKSPGGNSVFRMMEDRTGHFWFTNGRGMRNFDRETEKFSKLFTLENINWNSGFQFMAYEMKEDQEGYLWFRINHKLVRILPVPGGSLDMTVQDYWETDFTTAEINPMVSLLVEDPWNVWLSVPERGLCHVTVNRNKFRTILAPSIADAGTNKLPYVSSVYLDDRNKLWISTYTGRTTRMDLQKNLSEDFYPIPAPFILINSIDQDEYGNLWFAIKEGALARTVNGKNNSPNFALYYYFFDPSNPASLSRRNEAYFVGKGSVSPHLYEHLLFKDSQGTLWFNSGRGIHDRYDPEMDGFIHLDHRQVDTYNNDSCFAAGTESEIWFPSARGLLRVVAALFRN